jgi:hypothetical protein
LRGKLTPVPALRRIVIHHTRNDLASATWTVAPAISPTELIEVNSIIEHDVPSDARMAQINSSRAHAEEQRITELATLTKELIPIPE